MAQSDESALEDLLRQANEIDMRFQEVARSIPLYDQQQAAAFVEAATRPFEISGIAVKPIAGSRRLADASGRSTPVELHMIEISGAAEFREISRFLRALRLGPVLTGLESLRISADSSPQSRFVACVAVASLQENLGEESSAEESAEDALRRKLQRDRSKLDAVLRYLEEAQSDRRLDALDRFAESVAADHVALSEVLLRDSDRIELTGFAMGERALAGMETDLDDAGFIGRSIDLDGEKGCTKLRISATVRPGPAEDVVFAGRDPFDGGAAQRCAVRPEPPMGSIQAGGDGAPLIALRGVDFVDLFFVLHDLFALNFVIDEKVIGSVDLDVFDDAGSEDLLPALRRAVQIGEGPLHRVSTSTPAGSSLPSGGGEPVTFSFRRAPVRDLLCLARSIDGRELRIPKGSASRVSVFGENLPLDLLVSALTASAGFPPQSSLAGSAGEPACGDGEDSLETNVRIDPHAMRLEDFSASDLELAGIAILGSVRHAYVYTPGRVLRRIEAGQELFEGRVMEVTSSGVRVATSAGEVVLKVPGK